MPTIQKPPARRAGAKFYGGGERSQELAKETAEATEDIGEKNRAIQADTKSAVAAAIRDVSAVIQHLINDYQNTIASAVEEQTVTTNEISRNVSEAARGSKEIAENITGVAMTAKHDRRGEQHQERERGIGEAFHAPGPGPPGENLTVQRNTYARTSC